MGVDCIVHLPAHANVEDVATAIGALLGLPAEKKFIRSSNGPFEEDGKKGFYSAWADKTKVSIKMTDVSPGMLVFVYEKNPVDYEGHSVYFHFAGSIGGGKHQLTFRSTPVWIAVAEQLVELFGGSADYNDSDAVEQDIKVPRKKVMSATDGEAYYERQRRLYELGAITRLDITRLRERAAYK